MKLTNENIMLTAETFESFCLKHKVSHRRSKKVALITEEVLLNLQEHFGTEAEYEPQTKAYLGFPLLYITLAGEKFDPLSVPVTDGDDLDETLRNILRPDETKPVWKYAHGENRITISVSKRPKRSSTVFDLSLILPFVLAVAVALGCKAAPPAVGTFVLETLISPVCDILMKLLVMLTGPVIFFSLLMGILATDDISTLKKTGGTILKRFMLLSVLCIGICILTCWFFFPWQHGGGAAYDFGDLLSPLQNMVPGSLLTPFSENNLLQITFVAIFCGVTIIMLGNRVQLVKALIRQLNSLFMRMMNAVSGLIPILIFVSLTETMLENELKSLTKVWKFVAAMYVSMIVIAALFLLYVWLRRKVNIKKLFKKISPVLTVAFSTCSSTAAMEPNFAACKEMGIKEELTKLWLPLSHAMFSPSMLVPLICGTFFAVEMYDISISVGWMITLIFLMFQFGIASPKVPGGIIAVFSMLFLQMGLPSECVGLLVAGNSLAINFGTAYGMFLRECDAFDLACEKDCIDMDQFNS